MPEGDTVWRQARALDAALAGQVLTRCDIRVPRFATVDLTGHRVDAVVSRGKHLIVRIGDHVIRSHLKMEGAWHVYRGEPWRRAAFRARAVLETESAQAVGFDLGELEVLASVEEGERMRFLGPDLLGPDWDAEEAARRLASEPDVPVAVALADQRNLAGLGNVYVNELCFLRGVLPHRTVGEIDVPAMVDLAKRTITANRDRVSRITTGDTRRGRRLWVYGRTHERCRRCGTLLLHGRLGKRESELREIWWCPNCQR